MRNPAKKIMAALIATSAAAICIGGIPADTLTENAIYDRHGAIVRLLPASHTVWPVFSADSTFDGATIALDALKERGMKASFFFTGNFVRRPVNSAILQRIASEGHYIGPHSNGHLLYADWDNSRTPLVSTDSLLADLRLNIAVLDSSGLIADTPRWFMPPFEWIRADQAKTVADSLGLTVVNPVPGLEIYRDYTTPDMDTYRSSDELLSQFYEFERSSSLNGIILIMHLGTDSLRTDKLYRHIPAMLDSITTLGYRVDRLP